ncbi:MAG: glycoside hydrolase family 2 protein, partial [Clostridiales bacterium]|nr:glycoside hydrolase family 2 protein [Clostridiales bacterium]
AVSLTDAAGIKQIKKDRSVKVTVEGVGALQGLASADPGAESNFFDDEWMTYRGRMLAVIRSGESAGKVKVTVEAEGCEATVTEINVKGRNYGIS